MDEDPYRFARVRGQLVWARAEAGPEELEAMLAEREARAEATAAAAARLPASFAPDDARPLLLIDVDGVVCPYASELVDPAGAGLERIVVGHSHVWLSNRVADHLQELAESFQLVWCTAWEDHAAEFLAPHLGLPAMPVIRFDEPGEEAGHWKWPGIEAFVRDRPFAWIDDELGRDDFARAEGRPNPTLLVWIEGTHGLAEAHVDQLRRWSRGVSAT